MFIIRKVLSAIATVFAAVSVVTLIGCADSGGDTAKTPTLPEGNGSVSALLIRIDGKEVGYLEENADTEALSELFKQKKLSELSGESLEIVRIRLESELTGETVTCRPDEILSVEQLAEHYYSNGGRISFSVTVSENEKKYISFETVYNNSSAHYEGTKVVKTEGENGERTLKYEVTYTDGVETDRQLLSDTVTKKAVNKVVLLGTKKSTASTGSYRWPLSSVTVTSSYGNRYLNGKYGFHLGVDLRASSGTNVYAADGGKVVYAAWNGSYGYLIKIQHDNGDQTYYAHLSKISVSAGNRVYKGQIIAKSGATGNVTGPHLHFEIRKSGSAVDPVRYLPSLKNVTFAYSASPASCSLQTEACLSRSALPASSYSKREQEECPHFRPPSHAL